MSGSTTIPPTIPDMLSITDPSAPQLPLVPYGTLIDGEGSSPDGNGGTEYTAINGCSVDIPPITYYDATSGLWITLGWELDGSATSPTFNNGFEYTGITPIEENATTTAPAGETPADSPTGVDAILTNPLGDMSYLAPPDTTPPPPVVTHEPTSFPSPSSTAGIINVVTALAVSALQDYEGSTVAPQIATFIEESGSFISGQLSAIAIVANAVTVGNDLNQVYNDYQSSSGNFGTDVQTLVTDLGSGLATALALGVTIEGGPLAGIAVKAITAGAITTSAYLVGGLLKEAIENGQQTGVAEDESQIRGLATATPQSDPLILVANAPVPQDNFFLTSTGVLDHAMSAVTMASASTPDMLQQVAADGTYTVTAATIGVDIDNVYLSFLHNGEVGLAETLKLSADQSQFAKTTPTEQSLTAIAAGVSEALTGGTQQGAAAFFLQTMLTSELTGPVPYAGLDNLTYYLNTYAFGAQNGPGSIGMYMTDLATGMTASAAYTATTGQAAPK